MLVKRPFHRNHAEEPTVSEEELHDIIDNISEESAIDEDTTELVQKVLRFFAMLRDVLIVQSARVTIVSPAVAPSTAACSVS